MNQLVVLAYIIRQITGKSFSEDDFQPTELAIILSFVVSDFPPIRIVRENEPINIQPL